jgi:hypothetical protein
MQSLSIKKKSAATRGYHLVFKWPVASYFFILNNLLWSGRLFPFLI